MVFEFEFLASGAGVAEIAAACVVYSDGLRTGRIFGESVFRQPENAEIAQQYSLRSQQKAA